MDPSSLCSQGVTQSEAGLGNGGLNQGGSGLRFKCSGIDQVRPSLGSQLQKPFVETTNQFQLLSQQQWKQRPPQWLRLPQWLLRLLPLLLPLPPELLLQLLLQPELLQQLRQLPELLQPELLQWLRQLLLQPEWQRQWQQWLLQRLQPLLQELLQEMQRELLQLLQEMQQDDARLLPAQSRGSSIQASSPKVGVDSRYQEELTMEASTVRSLPSNPSSLDSQGVAQSKSGLVNGGLNQGGSGLRFKSSGIDQVRPSLGSQLQKPFVETTNQFQLLSQQQQLQVQGQQRLLQRLRHRLRHLLRQQGPLWVLQQLWQPQPLPQQLWQLLQERLLQQEWQQLPFLQLPQQLLQKEQQEEQLLLLQYDAQILLAQSRGSSIQANSPKVGVDSRDQEELTMEASTIRSPPINPSPLYSQGVAQSKAGLVNGGGSKGGSKCKEKLSSNTSSSQVDDDFDRSDEMGTDEINLIGSQNPKDKSEGKKKHESRVWEFFEKITDEDGTKRSKCKECGFKYLRDSRGIGTSTLHRHLAKCSKRATHDVGLLEPKDQGPETIQEKNIIEARTPERPCVPQAHISSAAQSRTTFSTPASGVLGTTPAAPTKRRRVAEMHTESDKSICSRNEIHDVGQLEPKDQGPEPFQKDNIIEARTPERPCVPQGRWSRWIDLTSPASGLLEPKDQGPEPIQEENIIETRTPERPCVPQAHISLAVQSPAGVLGTTPAVTTKRRRLAETHTESDKSVCSKTSAFRPTSHDSANKSAAGTEADEGKSSTPPAATEEEVQAPRDLQLSLATTKSGPQEESASVQQQFASAEELSSIGEQKKTLKFMLNCLLSGILDSLSKGQIECLGSAKIAVDRVLRDAGSAVDVKPLEAIFTELFASSKEWQSIQDPASLYQSEVLDPHARLRRELNEERELANEERSSRAAKFKQAKLYEEKSDEHKKIILSSLDQPEVLYRAMLRELYEERELENEEQSSWIDRCKRQLLLDMDKSHERQENILTEATGRLKRIEERVASKISRLKTFVSGVEGILGVRLESAVPEVAAQKYAAHRREAMKAQLQDFSGKINDFFKE